MTGLIFNQRIASDYKPSLKFFDVDTSQTWQLSKNNECYVCEKHSYTMIYYQRGILSQNSGLVEIKNKEFLAKLKKEFNGSYSKFTSTTPLICGTIVNHGIGQPIFDRKLKMIKAPFFGLLAMVQSIEYAAHINQSKLIHEYLLNFLQSESYNLLKKFNIESKFHGWQKILRNMCM